MQKEKNLEFKVGLFVVVSLVALTVFIFSISDSSSLKQGKTFKVVFDFSGGVQKNCPVRIAGVDEGIVKNVKLFFDRADSKTKAEIELSVSKDVQIPIDSVFTINQLGLMGEKYIEIMPGIDTRNFMEEGRTVIGKTPMPQNQVTDRIFEVANKLDATVKGINMILLDDTNQTSIRDTLKNLSRLTGSLGDLSEQVKTGEGTIGHLFYDNGVYDNIEAFTSDIKQNPWKLLYRPKSK